MISTADIISVLKGEIAGLHIKNAFSNEVSEEIAQNFSRSPGLNDRRDGVPGQYVGASHYRKDAVNYFADSKDARPFIDMLFGDLVDPVRGIFDALKRDLQHQGIELRLAQSEHDQANICRAIRWCGSGPYALAPHDDVAQVLCAESDFELSAVADIVCGAQFLPSMAKEGGDLRLWSHRPTAADRKAQEVETTGHSYSTTYLETVPYQDLQLRAGDIALIDGGFILGATSKSSGEKHRLVLNSVFGFARPDLVLWWT